MSIDLDAIRKRAEAAEELTNVVLRYAYVHDVPDLLAEVERLRRVVETLRAEKLRTLPTASWNDESRRAYAEATRYFVETNHGY